MRFLGALTALVILVAAACSPQQPSTAPTHAQESNISPPTPLLATAISRATHLGKAGSAIHVDLSLGLKVRQPDQLAKLIASGQTVTPDQYGARFGPDPAAVRAAVRSLTSAGLEATWNPASALMAAAGPAQLVDTICKVDIQDYRLAGGTTFYAALDAPFLPPEIAAVVTSITGLDNFRRDRTYAIRPGGMTPTDMIAFYNLKPLRDSGLDGSGITIVLPEIDDLPNLSDLNKFATKFGLPAYDPLVTIKRDPSWGTPEKPQGEAVLDLEVIHEIAPAAKMVVYLSAPDFAHADRAFDQLVRDHLGSVISESLGACEPETPLGHRDTYANIQDRSVAQGMSHFVASGDNGAFTCGVDQPPAASFPSTLANVTSVGGTTVFESVQGIYFKEAAWGGPVGETGSGGGARQFYTIPDYQKAVGEAAGPGFKQGPH